jgi:hypothetical protein
MQVRGSLSRIPWPISSASRLVIWPRPEALRRLHCRSHILPASMRVTTSALCSDLQHLCVLSMSLATAICNSLYNIENCVRPRILQSPNLALCIGKSLPALDLARNRHKFQHRLTHRLRALHQSINRAILPTLPCLPWWPESSSRHGYAGEALYRRNLQGTVVRSCLTR